MKILILDFDFFEASGGGQTYYAKLVERNPDHTFYFLSNYGKWQKIPYSYPENAHPIPFYSCLIHNKRIGKFESYMDQYFGLLAYSLAFSLRGMEFDIIDVPSFRPICQYLRAAFRCFNVKVNKIVFGLHGWVSVSIANDWAISTNSNRITEFQKIEHEALECADVRYAISKSHINHIETSLPINFLDPHNILEKIEIQTNSEEKPSIDLWFVGRIEKLKGIEFFLEIVSRIPKTSYGRICIAGPNGLSEDEKTWLDRVILLSREKDIDINYYGELDRKQLFTSVYAKNSIVFVTSLYDSFNLVATESLFSGCPTVISQNAGVHSFIQEEYPSMPFASFSPDNIAECVMNVIDLLKNYSLYKSQLVSELQKTTVKPFQSNFITPIYQSPIEFNAQVIQATESRFNQSLPQIKQYAPTVSIITPTCNRATYIEETVLSVLNQTYPFIQYLVINDGGVDDTRAILDKYLSHLQLITQENRGEPYAVNLGFQNIKGELIAIINDDDPVERNLVEEMVNVFAGREDIGVCYPDWRIIDQNGRTTDEIKTFNYEYLNMLSWFCCMPGPGTFFRSRVLSSAGKRDPKFRFMGDYEFWLRVGLKENFYRLAKPLATWRHHPRAATIASKGPILAAEAIKVMKAYYQRSNLPQNVLVVKRTAFANTYFHACMECWGNNMKLAYWYLFKALLHKPLLLFTLPPNHTPSRPIIRDDLMRRSLVLKYIIFGFKYVWIFLRITKQCVRNLPLLKRKIAT